MRGKSAKLMRAVGKGLTKKDKRLYNMLNSYEKGILSEMYKSLIANNGDVLKKQRKNQQKLKPLINETPFNENRKTRRFNDKNPPRVL